MRQHEIRRISTTPHYITAVIIAIAIFPKTVAVLSILYLACGDPLASLCGILYGHKGPRFASGKTLIGTMGGMLTCSLLTLIYLKTMGVNHWGQLMGVSLLGGIAGGSVELLPFEIDDNFTIPVVSGFILWFIFIIAGL